MREHGPKSAMSFTRANSGTREMRPKNGGACARMMKVLIGVDPHKASVALAVVDEVLGELLECAAFPHNRAGLRAFEDAGPNGLASVVVGRWRTLAASVGTWPRGWRQPVSRWWMCPPSFQRGPAGALEWQRPQER